MGKNTEDISISLNVSLKGSPKRVFPIKKNWNQNSHFKTRQKHYFLPKNWKLAFLRQKWCLGSQLWKNHRESLICYQEIHILLEVHVPSTDYSLSMGNFRGISSLSKGWPLFSGHIYVPFTRKKVEFAWFMSDRVLFSLNKRNFLVLWKKVFIFYFLFF